MQHLTAIALTLFCGSAAVAAGELPNRNQVDLPNLPLRLALDPCLDLSRAAEDAEAGELQALQRQQARLPAGTCNNLPLAEQLFQFQLLQNALQSQAPQGFYEYPLAQRRQQTLDACTSMPCLQQALDTMLPIVQERLQTRQVLSTRLPLCDRPSTALAMRQVWPLLRPADRRTLRQAQHATSTPLHAQQCSGSLGQWLRVTFALSGNQVNAPEWMFRVQKGRATLVADAEDGPLQEQSSRCNGLPDLVSTARINAGEHDTRLWQYNGSRYQVVMGYSTISAIEDRQGHSWPVVRDVDYRPIACGKR